MIHALPMVMQKAGSPMIGLPAKIARFVVVCVLHLSVSSVLKWRTRCAPGPPFFSCDTSPVHTTKVLIYIRSDITSSVGCVLCVPLPIRGGCRLQTLQYPFLDGSRVEMQPHIESGQTLRGSAGPHLRALFINLKDSSKQANELLHEPHTASL